MITCALKNKIQKNNKNGIKYYSFLSSVHVDDWNIPLPASKLNFWNWNRHTTNGWSDQNGIKYYHGKNEMTLCSTTRLILPPTCSLPCRALNKSKC